MYAFIAYQSLCVNDNSPQPAVTQDNAMLLQVGGAESNRPPEQNAKGDHILNIIQKCQRLYKLTNKTKIRKSLDKPSA